MSTALLTFSVLFLVASCSKVKELDGRTKNMDDNTQKMSKTTDKMSNVTEGMKDTTTTMYRQVRAKEAEETRHRSFEAILDEKNGMGTKISNAAVYFMSFEYQLWTGTSTGDNLEYREDLFLDAANEFTRKLNDIYPHINVDSMSPTSEGTSHNDEHSFYAIAAAMHMNHRYQEKLNKLYPEIELVSFYDLAKKALTKDFNNDLEQPEFERILLTGTNKDILVDLLKARVDILSALAIKNLTDKSQMSLGQKMKALLFKATGGKKGTIELPETYESANYATKETVETYLDGALKAKRFLKTIKIDKSLEKTVYSIMSNLKLTSPEKMKQDEKAQKLKSLISELLK